MEGDACLQSTPPHVLSDCQQSSFPLQVPITELLQRGMLHCWSTSFNHLSKFPVRERHPFSEPSSTHPLITHLSLKVPGKGVPLCVAPAGSLWRERCSVFKACALFIHFCQSPQLRTPPHEMGENKRSLSTEPHADGRPTCNGVWSGSPRGSFTTIQSLPQCHAVFSTIPSTLAWVDRIPVG